MAHPENRMRRQGGGRRELQQEVGSFAWHALTPNIYAVLSHSSDSLENKDFSLTSQKGKDRELKTDSS